MLQNMDSRARLPIRPACPHEPEHLTLVIDFCKKWWTRIATKEMAFIGIVTLTASLVASWLKQFPGFSLFGALIIALLIGMVAQFPIRKWYSSRSAEHKAGVKDAAGLISNKLLRLGIILLGFKLNLTVLFTQGIKCLPIAAVVVTLTIVVCYNIARKLGVDPQLAILVAGGTGICGAAAVMGLSGSIKVPPEKEDEKANNEVMAVAIIAIMGTIFALLEIALGPLTGLSKTQLGITAGASLHEIAHAVAAGDAFGAVDIATIMKLSRVLMLVFAAIIIAIWWDRNHSEIPTDGKRKVSFPWFMLGFIESGRFRIHRARHGHGGARHQREFQRHREEGTEGVPGELPHVRAAHVLRGGNRGAVLLIAFRCATLSFCGGQLDFGQQNRTENQRETA